MPKPSTHHALESSLVFSAQGQYFREQPLTCARDPGNDLGWNQCEQPIEQMVKLFGTLLLFGPPSDHANRFIDDAVEIDLPQPGGKQRVSQRYRMRVPLVVLIRQGPPTTDVSMAAVVIVERF